MALAGDLPSPSLGAIRELVQRPQWVCWKAVVTASTGKVKKIPIDPNLGKEAKVTNPNTWAMFDQAAQVALSTDANGVGFVLTGLEGYTAIDLDKVVDPDTLEIKDWAKEVVKTFDTYTEISPSLTGLHLWIRGRPPGPRCRNKSIEIYTQKRYLVVTGKWLGNYDQHAHLIRSDEIEDRQKDLDDLYEEAFETVPLYGEIPPPKPGTPTVESDPYGLPLPTSRQWRFAEALACVQRVMQDGRPFIAPNKLLAVTANDKRFAAIWRKEDPRAQRSCGADQSAWDMAIANRIYSADLGLSWHDMLAILITFREQYDNDETKLMRADYWARTIARASDNFKKIQEVKQDKLADEIERVAIEEIVDRFETAKTDDHKRAAIRDLCRRIGCPDIMKISRYRQRGENIYTIHFGDEDYDEIEGDVSILISQIKFRKIIADKTRHYVKPMSQKRWDAVIGILLASIEDSEIPPDVTIMAQMIELLQGYLAGQNQPNQFGSDNYLKAGPWWHNGQLIMKLQSFEAYLRRYHRLSLERRELARRLGKLGIFNKPVSYRVQNENRISSLSAYVIPDENDFWQLARNVPKNVQVLGDSEEI